MQWLCVHSLDTTRQVSEMYHISICEHAYIYMYVRTYISEAILFAGNSVPVVRGGYGQGNGTILLDNLNCQGDEASLLQCNRSLIIDCDHSEDAGVRCEGVCLDVRVCTRHIVLLY